MSDENDKLQEWIDPELEARVVAWVLGEASEFEAAELARIVAEKPELEIFKRRIEAVHGLVQAASRIETDPMRLDNERRRKLLETMRQKEAAAAQKVVAMPQERTNRKRLVSWKSALGIAACLALLMSLLRPAINSSKSAARRAMALNQFAEQNAPLPQQAPPTGNSENFGVQAPTPQAEPQRMVALESLKQLAEQQKKDEEGGAAPSSPNVPEAAQAGVNQKSEDLGFKIDTSGGLIASNNLNGVNNHAEYTTVAPGSAVAAPDSTGNPEQALADEAKASAGASDNSSVPSEQAVTNGVRSGSDSVDADAINTLQVQAPVGAAGTEHASQRTAAITRKLNDIVIPQIEFRDATVAQALDYLRQKSRDLDTKESNPSDRGVNITYQPGDNEPAPATESAPVASSGEIAGLHPVPYNPAAPIEGGAAPAAAGSSTNAGDARITLSLRNIPLMDALNYVAQLSNEKLKVNRNGVAVVPAEESVEELITKEYNVGPNFMAGGATLEHPAPGVAGAAADSTNSDSATAEHQSVMDYLTANGVQFPPGASAVYFPATHKLIVHNTTDNLDIIGDIADVSTPPVPANQTLAFNTGTLTAQSGGLGGTISNVAVLGDEATLGAVSRARLQPVPAALGEVSATDQPYSTFSLHVSDVSFQLARVALEQGQMPDPDSIRPEEFYNAFDYGDPAPGPNEKIACRIEQAAHPILQQRNLVRIAMKVAATGRGAGQPLRLTVLLDTSGSMEREDRAASVQRAFQVLTSLLGPKDAITLIGFARQPRLLAEGVAGDQAGKLVDIVKHTPADGGTNMEEAIKLASELALRDFEAGGQNRVVMLTDGAANLGNASPDQLSKLVAQLRQKGISFDACGVGASGLDDDMLEALTRKGDGRYYFLNQPGDADEGFARQLAGALRPAAENVKMQVRFNSARVGNYRLIGFEKHRLNQEDFRNDKVTAAQLAAEEAGVALYQVQVLPEGEGEVGEVFVRFRDPSSGQMVEQSWTIPYDAQAPALDKASPSMQLAATASLLAEKLRGGPIAAAVDMDALAPIITQVHSHYAEQPRVQDLVTMFNQTRRMTAGSKQN